MSDGRETASDIDGALRGAAECIHTAPHRVGDVWQWDEDPKTRTTVTEVLPPHPSAGHYEHRISLDGCGKGTPHIGWWIGQGWERVALAPAVSPVSTETPRETAEPGSLTAFGYECRRTYPATWRADSGLPSALSIVVREWPKTSTSPPGISVSVYQSATCLATAEASTVGDAEAACGMRLGQVVDAIRQLLTHGGE